MSIFTFERGLITDQNGNTDTSSQTITVNKLPKPPNKANSWGDTHLCTFDNLAYDFQAVGEFIFVRSTLPNDSFEVQVRQLPWEHGLMYL